MKIKMKIKGAIFDLDGTLLDSAWVWLEIDRDFLGARGISVPEDYPRAIMSMSFPEVARYTVDRFSLDMTPDEAMAEWSMMAAEAYAEKILLKPGAEELLAWLHEKKVPMGVATSNSALLYGPCLQRNGVYSLFHSFTETGDVARGKDSPDVYIEAAGKLGCAPEECAVFEDIIPALKSARRGGFLTFGVLEERWKYGREEISTNCDYVVESLFEAAEILENEGE